MPEPGINGPYRFPLSTHAISLTAPLDQLSGQITCSNPSAPNGLPVWPVYQRQMPYYFCDLRLRFLAIRRIGNVQEGKFF